MSAAELSASPLDGLPSPRACSGSILAALDGLRRAERIEDEREAIRWLTAVVARFTQSEDANEAIIEQASALLATLAGRSARGASTETFSFRRRTGDALSVVISSGTLTEESLGSLTWAAAPLLSGRIVADPARFLASSVRVLELGCGTGLVGIAAALSEPSIELELWLADFDQNALQLAAINCERNGVKAQVERLDWREQVPKDWPLFDVIFASDPVYDIEQLEPLRSTIDRLLSSDGVAHIVVPMRATHQRETDAATLAFSSNGFEATIEDIEGPSDAHNQSGLFRYMRVHRASRKITMLYFASARDALDGLSTERIELPGAVRHLRDLATHLLDRHSANADDLRSVLKRSAYSVNEELAQRDDEATLELRDGDEIAIIPPVSGG